ncbi:hypothetical protein MMC28_007090 [Mycoblastus sanguinarius]|nr:hypothetical protein [Mycoblastus sanguinarius]
MSDTNRSPPSPAATTSPRDEQPSTPASVNRPSCAGSNASVQEVQLQYSPPVGPARSTVDTAGTPRKHPNATKSTLIPLNPSSSSTTNRTAGTSAFNRNLDYSYGSPAARTIDSLPPGIDPSIIPNPFLVRAAAPTGAPEDSARTAPVVLSSPPSRYE